jgi:DNA-binding transcriptional LysR family regulator
LSRSCVTRPSTPFGRSVCGEIPLVSLGCQSVASDLPDGVVAVPLSEPIPTLDTHLVWRANGASATVDAFRAVAREVYNPDPSVIG